MSGATPPDRPPGPFAPDAASGLSLDAASGPIAPAAVVALARALLAAPLGGELPRVFLAGGAFETLLHGRPPRDLDLWAESAADRVRLVGLLRARGAEPQPAAPGAERFVLAGQRIEVSWQVEQMEPRLARFDLGLACVAVAFRGEAAVPLVHPRALESVARREVLLIAITFWQLALATLVRARRYADDLDYRVSDELEGAAWALFAARRREEQAEMIAQLERYYGAGTYGVRDEAAARLGQGG